MSNLRLYKVDRQGTVLGGHRRSWAYTPFGAAPAASRSGLGYTGQWFERVSGAYHLGHGTRLYSPSLMRFESPDPMSPFDAGGINAYAYCLGDPINRVDPTGHESSTTEAWLSLAVNSLTLFISGLRGAAIYRHRRQRVPQARMQHKMEVAVTASSAVASVIGLAGAVDYLAGGRNGAFDVIALAATLVAVGTSGIESWLLFRQRPAAPPRPLSYTPVTGLAVRPRSPAGEMERDTRL